jgi:hypothetical protein
MPGEGLGGYFYDYIRGQSGRIVGLRYWGETGEILWSNEIFRRFRVDKRFFFCFERGFVDFLFEAEDVAFFKQDKFWIDVVQDFGGDSVVMSGDLYGILIRFEQ